MNSSGKVTSTMENPASVDVSIIGRLSLAADQWHAAEWRKFVTEFYGSDPEVRPFEVPIVADNELDQAVTFSIDEAV